MNSIDLNQLFLTAEEHDTGLDDNGRMYFAARHGEVWTFITLMEDGTYTVSE